MHYQPKFTTQPYLSELTYVWPISHHPISGVKKMNRIQMNSKMNKSLRTRRMRRIVWFEWFFMLISPQICNIISYRLILALALHWWWGSLRTSLIEEMHFTMVTCPTSQIVFPMKNYKQLIGVTHELKRTLNVHVETFSFWYDLCSLSKYMHKIDSVVFRSCYISRSLLIVTKL